jgi:DNA-binding response OmpR family regulator
MEVKEKLRGKRILIVDDEKDVLDVLSELLSVSRIDTASTFEEARNFLLSTHYDIIILDIMGVNGFDLLEIANEHNIPALMLTAHALSEESLLKSEQKGAAYFVPKDEMANIASFVATVLEAVENKKDPWPSMVERLGSFYDKRFKSTDWRRWKDRDFLKRFLRDKGI